MRRNRKIRRCNQSQNITEQYEKKDMGRFFLHDPRVLVFRGARVKHKVTRSPVHTRAGFSGNSKPTFPSSNFRQAEKGWPRFEMKPSRRSVLPAVRSFCACSCEMSRPRIVLLSLNLQGLLVDCERSQI